MATTSAPHVQAEPGRSGSGSFLTQILSDRERFFTEVAAGEGLPAKLRSAGATLARPLRALRRRRRRVCRTRAGPLDRDQAAAAVPRHAGDLLPRVLRHPGARRLAAAAGAGARARARGARAERDPARGRRAGHRVLPAHRRELLLPHAAARRDRPRRRTRRHGRAARGARVRVRAARRLPEEGDDDHAGVGRPLRVRRHPDGVEPAAVRRRPRRAVPAVPAQRGQLLHRHRLLAGEAHAGEGERGARGSGRAEAGRSTSGACSRARARPSRTACGAAPR